MFTDEQIERWTKSFDESSDIRPYMKEPGIVRDHVLEMWMCGEWLDEQLDAIPETERNFTDEEKRSVLFAFGQRCAFSRPEDIKPRAQKMLAEFLSGHREPPPEELAKEINDKCLRFE